MSNINLTKAVRTNLLTLQNTAQMMAKTQDKLATGNKVNTALDNPSSFFTAASLNSRASDLGNLQDSMATGIKTLEAADNGLTSITKTLESMQSTLRQARQDKTFETASYSVPTGTTSGAKTLDLTGGAFGTATSHIDLTTKEITTAATAGSATVTTAAAAIGTLMGSDTIKFSVTVDGGTAQEVEITASDVAAAGNQDSTIDNADEFASILRSKINSGKLTGVEITNDATKITLKSQTSGTASKVEFSAATVGSSNGSNTTATTLGMGSTIAGAAGAAATYGDKWKSVDTLVNEINNSNSLNGKVKASNDNGQLRIQNLSTQDLKVDGVSSGGAVDGSSKGAAKILGNSVRTGFADQFNELRDQLDKLADDASFNGINLLRGDKLSITFNETGTSSISVSAKNNQSVDSTSLGVPSTIAAKELDSDSKIDGYLSKVKSALDKVRSQSSAFGSNLSVVQNRQDFTKNMMNTLQTGAGNLTLADMNEEAANMVALQTRQSLATSSLSMANQSDQAVLQLLR